jgi:hypothetical protein
MLFQCTTVFCSVLKSAEALQFQGLGQALQAYMVATRRQADIATYYKAHPACIVLNYLLVLL